MVALLRDDNRNNASMRLAVMRGLEKYGFVFEENVQGGMKAAKKNGSRDVLYFNSPRAQSHAEITYGEYGKAVNLLLREEKKRNTKTINLPKSSKQLEYGNLVLMPDTSGLIGLRNLLISDERSAVDLLTFISESPAVSNIVISEQTLLELGYILDDLNRIQPVSSYCCVQPDIKDFLDQATILSEEEYTQNRVENLDRQTGKHPKIVIVKSDRRDLWSKYLGFENQVAEPERAYFNLIEQLKIDGGERSLADIAKKVNKDFGLSFVIIANDFKYFEHHEKDRAIFDKVRGEVGRIGTFSVYNFIAKIAEVYGDQLMPAVGERLGVKPNTLDLMQAVHNQIEIFHGKFNPDFHNQDFMKQNPKTNFDDVGVIKAIRKKIPQHLELNKIISPGNIHI